MRKDSDEKITAIHMLVNVLLWSTESRRTILPTTKLQNAVHLADDRIQAFHDFLGCLAFLLKIRWGSEEDAENVHRLSLWH